MVAARKKRQLFWLIAGAIFVAFFEITSFAGIRMPTALAFPLFLSFTLVFGYETLWHGLKAFASFNLRSINFLMLIAVVGAFYLGEYPEGAIVIILYTLAEKLEDLGLEKSRSALDSLVNAMPKSLQIAGSDHVLPLEQVAVGTCVVIKPFQMIPIDGVVTKGLSFVDESAITGEPLAKDKREGDAVYAGSFNKQGSLEIQVSQIAADSTIE